MTTVTSPPRRPALFRLGVSQRKSVTVLVALAPALLLLGVLFLLPLLQLGSLSLTDGFPTPTETFTFANYIEAFTRAYHVDSLMNSLWLSTVTMVITAILGYPLAYYLVHSDSKMKSFILMAILSPLLISIVVRSIGWLILLGQEGLVNGMLTFFNIVDEPVQLLYTFGAVVIGEVNILMPFMVLSLTTSLGQIPHSLHEGAQVMGAGPARRFFRITLPLSSPGLVSGCMLVFILTMGSYITPQMLGGGKVKVITTDIYSRMMVDFNWPLGAALAIVTLLFTLTFIMLINLLQSRLLGGMTR